MKFLYRVLWYLERKLVSFKLNMVKSNLKHCGNNVKLYPTVYIFVPQRLSIGNNTSIAPNTTIYAAFRVSIGDNCLISSNCGISSYNHISLSDNRMRDRAEDEKYSKPVTIGNNVWIAMNVCILPGVTIGDNSIIGSGSVVTKNIPANEIWAGNPARFIKSLNI